MKSTPAIHVTSHISLAGVLLFIVGCFPFLWGNFYQEKLLYENRYCAFLQTAVEY